MTYENAKQLVIERWSRLWESEFGIGLVVVDSETVEYEWGWLFSYAPSDPDRVPEEHWLAEGINMTVVDRDTGNAEDVATSGPNLAILALLERRPPELRGDIIQVRPLGGLSEIRVARRAFTPLRRPNAGSQTER